MIKNKPSNKITALCDIYNKILQKMLVDFDNLRVLWYRNARKRLNFGKNLQKLTIKTFYKNLICQHPCQDECWQGMI